MIPVVLLGGVLFAVSPAGDAPPGAAVLKEYQALKPSARDAAGHVKLALWCEAHGLTAEHARELATAVLTDPKNAAARGLSGLVAFAGGWTSPDGLPAKVQADESLKASLTEYNARRARTPDTAEAQWKLALWCLDQSLEAEAAAHLTAVVRRDPSRAAAWRRLGYERHNGRWMTAEQDAAAKDARAAQAQADKVWPPRLEKWRLLYRKPATRLQAQDLLATVNDPMAVGPVWRTFATGDELDQAMAVQTLGRLEGLAASQALAVLAFDGASPEIRRRASESLRRRDPREYLGGLIALFRRPPRILAKLVGADGIGSPGFLAVEGPDAIYQTIFTVDESVSFDPAMSTNWGIFRATAVAQGLNNGPVSITPMPSAASRQLGETLARENVRLPAPAAGVASQPVAATTPGGGDYFRRVDVQNQVMARVAAEIATSNVEVNQTNAAAREVLYQVTGQDFGTDTTAWLKWWADQQGLVYETSESKPTVTEEAVYEPKPVVTVDWVHYSCFAAGTPVRTIDGLRAIEKLRVGDRVLVQDVETGLLELQPVVAVYHNRPAATLRLDLGGDSVVATGIHRFWKAGHGWVMARDLKAGDRVRTVGGMVTVGSVEPDREQRVFNLEVARGRSFFVGKAGALVHDHSLVLPVLTAFDAVPELTPAR
jgi:hypothetical protein